MKNHLKDQTSPYLLQHAENPVEWYPWGKEALERAKQEDKPIFLSIGYSTCHWCHVMAHESFEDEEIARRLNKSFVSIKVDKEERPDIDSVYMSVCQALTGSGGWPTTIFMTPEQKPFFAGTYFPRNARHGMIGFEELLLTIEEKWKNDKESLLQSADEILSFLKRHSSEPVRRKAGGDIEQLLKRAAQIYKSTFDRKNGGFGSAPKFPSAHNLLFMMKYYEEAKDEQLLDMVEKTLIQMYRGGIFDHIGGGFSRYSTDERFLAPHFEKMLYDNALLIMAYCKAYELTKNKLYKEVALRTVDYVLREMTSSDGGFYSAQDADSEGVEGKYYLFSKQEVIQVLGKEKGAKFCDFYDVSDEGNFEGKNIVNLLKNESFLDDYVDEKKKLYEYRKKRYALHLDDKILTSWNGLMIGAMCQMYKMTEDETYLDSAAKAWDFIQNNLRENDTIFVSWRDGKRSGKGFLDDYANIIFGLLSLYEAVQEEEYLTKAQIFTERVIAQFYDNTEGGFFLNGQENESLIIQPKEIYDGAMPSGNSMMAYNLVQLAFCTEKELYIEYAKKQLRFMKGHAVAYPTGYAMFLLALLEAQTTHYVCSDNCCRPVKLELV